MARTSILLCSAILAVVNAAPQLPFLPMGPLPLVGVQDRPSARPGAVKKAFVYGPFTLKGKDV